MLPSWFSPFPVALRPGRSIDRVEGAASGYRFKGCIHGVPWHHGGEVDSVLGVLESLVGDAEVLPFLTVQSQLPSGRRWPSPPGNLYAAFFTPHPIMEASNRLCASIGALLARFTNRAEVRQASSGDGLFVHRSRFLGGFKLVPVEGGALAGVDIHVAAAREVYVEAGQDDWHAFLDEFCFSGESATEAQQREPLDVLFDWAPHLARVLQVRPVRRPDMPITTPGSTIELHLPVGLGVRRDPLDLWEAVELGTYLASHPFHRAWSAFRLPPAADVEVAARLERWGLAVGLASSAIRDFLASTDASVGGVRADVRSVDAEMRALWGQAVTRALGARGVACFVLASSLAHVQAALLYVLLPATVAGPVDWAQLRGEVTPHLRLVRDCVAELGPDLAPAERAVRLVEARLGQPVGAVFVALAGELLELALQVVVRWAAREEGHLLAGDGFGRARALGPTPAAAMDRLVEDLQQQRWFISYSAADARYADVVQEALVGAGVEVFLDHTTLPVGALLTERIRAAIETSTHFVLLWGADTHARAWVEMEWRTAVGDPARYVGVLVIPGGDPSRLPALLAERSFADGQTDLTGALARLALAMSASPFRRFVVSRRTANRSPGP